VPRLEILPPPEAGDRQRLRERVVRLHELVREERARPREMMIANQQIREQVAQGRALRAAARAAAGSPALPA
jgi:hypothetical protein